MTRKLALTDTFLPSFVHFPIESIVWLFIIASAVVDRTITRMARGDECKHVTAVATYLASSSPKKVEMATAPVKPSPSPKAQEKPKDYGSWGPVYKNKQNFVNMHSC